ncbi:GNAT family N-acetyltransferase [Amycolatopsis sp. NPDC051045]|uniref:GNAT family N-acetyltransferase n=1 Tax=Amycolatopsis sp. NPDC051045 TaxID=3156922 RepID=UPI00343D3273
MRRRTILPMSVVKRRSYTGPADLRAMQSLAQRIWSKASSLHVEDLAWQRFQHAGREAEWPTVLWEAGGEVVAWGWISLPGELTLLVDPARPQLASEVLGWFEDTAPAAELAVTVLDAEKHVIAALERSGYALQESPVFQSYLSRLLVDLPEPVVPGGFTVRPVGPDDLARRVAVHRVVWHPSRVTESSYRTVMAAWPYRGRLDWVVEAPDGRFAAQCLIWLDDRNAVGELEPVGTLPEFRRTGLARAVCLAALHAAHHAGAREAVAYPVIGHPKSVGALPLYRDLGFRPYARTLTFTRTRRRIPPSPGSASPEGAHRRT